MSKIGRKPISFSSAKIEVKGNTVFISGSKGKFEHEFPEGIAVTVEDKAVLVGVKNGDRSLRAQWGLHRALLANKIKGVESGFEQLVKIVGLGYKAQLSGKKMVLSLGYSHKIEYLLPEGIALKLDKTGQQLAFSSHDKWLLGKVCDDIRSFRKPEPYKGTGIMLAEEVIKRKAGKTGT